MVPPFCRVVGEMPDLKRLDKTASTGANELTAELSIASFRARSVAKLWALNNRMPRSERLDRREIDRLVEELFIAFPEAPKRRGTPTLKTILWLTGKFYLRAIGLRRRTKRAGAPIPATWPSPVISANDVDVDKTMTKARLSHQIHIRCHRDGIETTDQRAGR